jgi:hypothetical protein
MVKRDRIVGGISDTHDLFRPQVLDEFRGSSHSGDGGDGRSPRRSDGTRQPWRCVPTSITATAPL